MPLLRCVKVLQISTSNHDETTSFIPIISLTPLTKNALMVKKKTNLNPVDSGDCKKLRIKMIFLVVNRMLYPFI